MVISIQQIARQNRFQRRLQDAKDRERRGAPIPREIAARMTKPKVADKMFQVFVDIKGEHGSRPVSPMFAGEPGGEACGHILEAINAQICLGKLKGWGNARIEAAAHIPAH